MRRELGWLETFVVAATLLASAAAHAQSCPTPLPPLAGYPAEAALPLTLLVPQREIIPVAATDGYIHLAYAAQVTNISREKLAVRTITPVDPLNGFKHTGDNSVLDQDGRQITSKVRLFDASLLDGTYPANQIDFRDLPGGSAGTTFFDIRYRHASDVPRLLSHWLTLTRVGSTQPDTELVNPVPVSCHAPVRLHPPLTGDRWWDSNGCCEVVSNHRGALLPINGTLVPPEQFAIDYEQLRSDNTCCTGPVTDLQSWPFFGAPILAAADGTVVEAVDGLPEQPVGHPTGITIANAAGNHVIEDIGGGRYVLYAHMRNGSLPKRLVTGARLGTGERIGNLGNTGSSTGPHLHFQVMDRPSTLNSVGLPFVFDRQLVQGRVIGTANDSNRTYDAGRALVVDQQGSGWQSDRMPAEGQVFGFTGP